MLLWLDDVRDPTLYLGYQTIGWTWVKTADAAITALETGTVIAASLDHDLTDLQTLGEEDNEKTGYSVVLFLEQNPQYWPPRGVYVHSMNPSGRQRMQQVIDRYYKGAEDVNKT